MENYELEKDITVFYITATSFPGGVMQAHQQLHTIAPADGKRNYFGISRPENKVIVYHAAAEELSTGEGNKLGCKTMVIKKGTYTCIVVADYNKNIPAIAHAFEHLLISPGLDPEGYCVEWYFNGTDVRCMVRMKES